MDIVNPADFVFPPTLLPRRVHAQTSHIQSNKLIGGIYRGLYLAV